MQNSGWLEDTRKYMFGNSWLWFSIHWNETDTFSSTHNVPDAGNFLMHNYWTEEKCSALLWSRSWIIHPELSGYITIFKRNIQTIISLWPSFTYTLQKVSIIAKKCFTDWCLRRNIIKVLYYKSIGISFWECPYCQTDIIEIGILKKAVSVAALDWEVVKAAHTFIFSQSEISLPFTDFLL